MHSSFPEYILLNNSKSPKPFLKWAGGKRQLLPAIKAALPDDINEKKNFTYVEPFVGSGAVMFWFLQEFPGVKKAVINDINTDLCEAFNIIKQKPHQLIKSLSKLQKKYYALALEEDRKLFFLQKREAFNQCNLSSLARATLLIFLNRTCYNGLYRVNSKNKFNVPFGKYHQPKICDEATILHNSTLLQKTIILNGDYADTLKYATKNSFFYLDPPYKPISKTSYFNSYAANIFDDEQQLQLSNFCKKLNAAGHQWLLSNSDVKNNDEENNFFEALYGGFTIKRIKARRAINSNVSKRGKIFELLIKNY